MKYIPETHYGMTNDKYVIFRFYYIPNSQGSEKGYQPHLLQRHYILDVTKISSRYY